MIEDLKNGSVSLEGEKTMKRRLGPYCEAYSGSLKTAKPFDDLWSGFSRASPFSGFNFTNSFRVPTTNAYTSFRFSSIQFIS